MTNNEIKRPLTKILNEEIIEKIIEEAEEVLEKVGVWVQNQEGLQILSDGGATVNKQKEKVTIPRRLIEESLKTVPSTVKLYDRKGTLSANLEGDNIHFNPGSAANKMYDFKTKQIREATTEDHIRHIRLVDALKNIDILSPGLIPNDVPPEVSDRYRVYLSLKNSSKCIWTGTFKKDGFDVEKSLLVAVRGGEKSLKEKPLAYFACTASPPLKWSDLICHDIIECSKNWIPIQLGSMPLSGFAAPITILGSLVQHTAESLSGLVISQLVNPGAPVILGGSPAPFDMRYGITPMGAIETSMLSLGYNEIGKYLKIPTMIFIGHSDAKRLDSQSGLETGIGIILAALSGANIITGSGMLNTETTQSLEKLVIDNEICGMARRFIRGVSVRDDRLAEDLFTEGLYEGQHFLTSPTTIKLMREEIYYPGPVIDRYVDQEWIAKGSTTAEQRANIEVEKILQTHTPEPLDSDIEKELTKIMSKSAKEYGMDKLPPAA